MSVTPARRAAATMARLSSTVEAIGFSTITWMPCAAHAIAMSRCRCVGAAMVTASTPWRNSASASSKAAQPILRATVSRRWRSGSATPTRFTPGNSDRTRAWLLPITPTPTTPTRNVSAPNFRASLMTQKAPSLPRSRARGFPVARPMPTGDRHRREIRTRIDSETYAASEIGGLSRNFNCLHRNAQLAQFAGTRLSPSSVLIPPCAARSRPAIIVFDADDIVLAEIAAGLHLDQFEVDLARIFQAMLGPARNIRRFVFVQDLGFVADRDPRGAAHHDPVLGAMMMQLQRQPPARLHHDAFDLKGRTPIDG